MLQLFPNDSFGSLMQRSKVVNGVKLEEQLLDMTRTLPGHCFHREEKLRIFHSEIESLSEFNFFN